MGLVKCLRMKNKAIVTSFGRFQFDENGVANIPDEHEDKITALKGYEKVSDEDAETEIKDEKEEEVEVTSTEEEKVEIEDSEDSEEDAKEEEVEEVEEKVEEKAKFTKKQLQDKTINDLKKLANELGIDVSKADKKAEFVDIIFDAQ